MPVRKLQAAMVMNTHKLYALAIGLGTVLAACSSSSDDEKAGGLEAPMLMQVMPMEGALHLEWMNVQADCDTVEAERKTPDETFGQLFSVPGSVDNKMDTTATENMTYTYRLRCKKGASFSGYSEELSANPTEE